MTHKTYFRNFFVALAAALSDDDFLAFAEKVLANLDADPAAKADADYLRPLVAALRQAHQARGPLQGASPTGATLRQTVREFLAWARLTNVQKVFPAFPDRNQAERLDIFPGGMEYLYQADYNNIGERAARYVERISRTYGAKTGVSAAEADARLATLTQALGGHNQAGTARRGGAVAVDAQEEDVCQGLYRAYAGLLYRHFERPELAYAAFSFPQSTGTPDDDNLPSLPGQA